MTLTVIKLSSSNLFLCFGKQCTMPVRLWGQCPCHSPSSKEREEQRAEPAQENAAKGKEEEESTWDATEMTQLEARVTASRSACLIQ